MVKTTFQMLNKFLNFILLFFWSRLEKGLTLIYKRYLIDKEVAEEEREIAEIRKEIKKHFLETGNTKVPKELEDRLRHAVSRRNDKLPDGV